MVTSPEPMMMKIRIDHDYLGSTTVELFTEIVLKMGWVQQVTVVERARDGNKEAAVLCICFGDHTPDKDTTRDQIHMAVRQLVYLMFPSETETEIELQHRSLIIAEFKQAIE
jgi:hypothetical protein